MPKPMKIADRIKQAVNGFKGMYASSGSPSMGGQTFNTTDTSFNWSPSIAQFMEYNGKVLWQNTNSSSNFKYLFEVCAPLNSIVNKKADAFINGRIKVISRTTEKEVRGKDKDWQKLLNKPNSIQGGRAFRRQLYLFTQMYGYCYVLPVYPVGFTDRPEELWILPPWHVLVRRNYVQDLMPGQIDRQAIFSWQGQQTIFNEAEDLWLFTNGSADLDENTWLPKSKVVNLQFPITNLIGAYESLNSLIRTRGAQGILSNDAKDMGGVVPLKASDKEELQQDYRSYGLSNDQWKLIITNANLKYQSMVMKVKDLQLYEGKSNNIEDICDGYCYPYYLMSNGKGATFANVDEAEKHLYQNVIIPESEDFFEQFNNNAKTIDLNIEITASYEHVEAMQESEAEAATGRKYTMESMLIAWEMGNCTQDDVLEARGEDRLMTEENMMTKPFYDKWLRDQDLLPQMIISEQPSADLTALQQQSQPAKHVNLDPMQMKQLIDEVKKSMKDAA